MRSIKHKTTSGKSIDLKKEGKKLKGISRIDSTNTHGWFVRVYRNDVIYSKLFSDSRYGDKDKALGAAKAYRDEFEILLDRKDKYPRRNNRLPVVTKNRRNKTGVVGVCHRKRRLPSGKVAECYSVTWAPEPNVQKCTSFSIAKYGKRQAFKKAKELREKMVKSMMGEESLPKSTKKSKGRRYQKAEKVMKKLRRKQDPKRNMAA
jgi:hypothetical protein